MATHYSTRRRKLPLPTASKIGQASVTRDWAPAGRPLEWLLATDQGLRRRSCSGATTVLGPRFSRRHVRPAFNDAPYLRSESAQPTKQGVALETFSRNIRRIPH